MRPPSTALVIDDDALVRTVVIRQLQSAGIQNVLAAADADQARFLLRHHSACGLVVCDLDVPGAQGNELIEDLGRMSPGMPIILMTSLPAAVLRSAEKLSRRAGLEVLGANRKPVTSTMLLQMIQQAPEPAVPAWGTPDSALVVDDDALVRSLLVRMLTNLGVRSVMQAPGGAEARALLADAPCDLLLTDLDMPGTDGVELLRELSELRPGAAVALVSSAPSRVLQTASEAGTARGLRVLGTLAKPVRLEALQALLREWQPAAAAPRVVAQAVTPAELRDALQRREFSVYVQPQVHLATGAVHSAEALVRWHRGGATPVPPDVFIGLAEQEGLMDALTRLVLEQAAAACAGWGRAGHDMRISVNVPITSFERLDLPETVCDLAVRHGLEPRRLMIEVTESAVAAHMDRVLDVAARLLMRGIELSIDDFGTGYSSLTQLRRLPFSELKSDRSFTAAALHDPAARSIVESTVELAHKLGLKVVAEGVETEAHAEFLRRLRCDYAQGYLYGRPFPAADLPAWLAAFRPPAPGA